MEQMSFPAIEVSENDQAEVIERTPAPKKATQPKYRTKDVIDRAVSELGLYSVEDDWPRDWQAPQY